MDFDAELAIPVAAVVAIALLAYFLLVLILAAIWRLLQVKGILKSPQPVANDRSPAQCCDPFCRLLSDSFGCGSVSLASSLKSMCPRKRLNLEPLVTCPCIRDDHLARGGKFGYLNCVCCEINTSQPMDA